MQVFNEINENKGLSLAFGFFDGVHIGHQEVIKSAGGKCGAKTAVITFQDHPCCYFYDIKPKYIITKHDKVKMFEDLGVDYLYFLKFDEHLAKMNATEYMKEVIVKNFAPVAISTGFNHSFGAHKSGDVNFLKKSQKEFNFEYFEVPPVLYNSEIVSSTRIREDLSLGNIEMVNAMLGYDYFFEETVVEGQHLGRELGFKTANLIYPDNLVEIGRGVYKVNVEYDGQNYDGIANYGLRPTVSDVSSTGDKVGWAYQPNSFKSDKPVLEVHILNFDKEIYGEKIKVTFLKKIRDEKKFDSLEGLKNQIIIDLKSI